MSDPYRESPHCGCDYHLKWTHRFDWRKLRRNIGIGTVIGMIVCVFALVFVKMSNDLDRQSRESTPEWIEAHSTCRDDATLVGSGGGTVHCRKDQNLVSRDTPGGTLIECFCDRPQKSFDGIKQ